MKIVKIFFILVLLIFPFGELLRFTLSNNIVIKPLDIVVALTGLNYIFLSVIQRRNPFIFFNNKDDKLWKLALFPFIASISLLFNAWWLQPQELVTASFYLFRWISYFLLFFIVLSFDISFKKLVKKVLFIDGLLIVLVGFLQYFFYNSLKGMYYLGWDEHMYRIFSTFLDPNFTGAFLVLYLLFILGFLMEAVKKKEKRKKIFCSIFSIIILIAIFLTYSRSAWLMLFVSTISFFMLIKQIKFVLIVGGVICLFFVAVLPLTNTENTNLFRTASSTSRLESAASALFIIQKQPILGVGFNSYRYAKNRYGIKQGWSKAPSHADAGVDNSFLFVLATTGIVGFVAYGYLWFTLIQQTVIRYKKNNLAGALILSSILGLCIHALFINSLFFAPLMFWIWILIPLLW
jgi:O-antigen ligase